MCISTRKRRKSSMIIRDHGIVKLRLIGDKIIDIILLR